MLSGEFVIHDVYVLKENSDEKKRHGYHDDILYCEPFVVWIVLSAVVKIYSQ